MESPLEIPSSADKDDNIESWPEIPSSDDNDGKIESLLDIRQGEVPMQYLAKEDTTSAQTRCRPVLTEDDDDRHRSMMDIMRGTKWPAALV
mgnify:CR=1 FL=1